MNPHYAKKQILRKVAISGRSPPVRRDQEVPRGGPGRDDRLLLLQVGGRVGDVKDGDRAGAWWKNTGEKHQITVQFQCDLVTLFLSEWPSVEGRGNGNGVL